MTVEGMGVWQLKEWECDSGGNGSVTVEGIGCDSVICVGGVTTRGKWWWI